MSLSRLSDLNITDSILRAGYYQKVVDHSCDVDSDLTEHTIKQDEQYRPDLVASRLGDAQLAWMVLLICEVDDPADPLPVGETVYFPQASWIRRSMREYMDELGLPHA